MKGTRSTLVLFLATGTTGGLACAQPFAATGIGNLSGGPSIAWGVSSWPGLAGAVVGETDINNSLTHRACTFTTSMAAINTGSGPGGNFVPKIAYRMNSNPSTLVHVGSGSSASLSTRAFRTQAGLTFELGTLNPLLQNSEARGVNFNGVVVGTCWAMNSFPGAGAGSSFAFQWVPTAGPSDNNGTMSMIPLHAAYDVNDSGVAVGSLGSLPYRLIIATSTLTSMGTLGGPTGSGVATAINNAGVAVGSSPTAPIGLQHAFRWTPGGGMQDINPAPLGSTVSYAYDIADGGGPNALIVGRFISSSTGPGGHAFIYNPANGFFRDLNTWLPSGSGWVLESAHGINDALCVVGRGRRNGQLEGFKICVSAPLTPQAPCNGGPLNPIPNQSACPGTAAVFEVDPTPVGGGAPGSVSVEWSYRYGTDSEWQTIVNGPNGDNGTGQSLFHATLGGPGSTLPETSLAITDVSSPPHPGVPQALTAPMAIRALVRGPCDTLIAPSALRYLSPGDVGVQGGLPGKDGIYDNNDFIAYIDGFFEAAPWADVGVQGGVLGSDGLLNNNDFVVFIDRFFEACPG